MIVMVSTLAGLVGLLSFHTTPGRLTLGGPAGTSATRSVTSTSVAAGPPAPTTTPTTATPANPGATTTAPPATAPTTTTTTPAASRTATGDQVNYSWGVLSVSVTATGSKITKVGIGTLDDGGNPRSQSIDQQSIPILEQQAMQAQSANIQGVSGASYTSAGFQQSLQSALSKLNIK